MNSADQSEASEASATQSDPSSSPQRTCVPALKEWATVCNAILEGEQVVTIRKGGIKEDGRHFSVPYDRFLLFPTYEHQSGELLKPAYRHNLERLRGRTSDGIVEIEGWCDVTGVKKLTEPDALAELDSKHIWTADYVTERLRWKARDPLWVLVLRAHLLPQTVEIPILDEYGGCKSWIEIEASLDFKGEAVLSDGAFEAKTAGIL
ncbi:MAG: hypothetical protein DCC49_09505 [Acidobacteria bacterium]|nr:MAG: hypothetical protein DCC49_09505 [Acidobacteriota bacterium]